MLAVLRGGKDVEDGLSLFLNAGRRDLALSERDGRREGGALDVITAVRAVAVSDKEHNAEDEVEHGKDR